MFIKLRNWIFRESNNIFESSRLRASKPCNYSYEFFRQPFWSYWGVISRKLLIKSRNQKFFKNLNWIEISRGFPLKWCIICLCCVIGSQTNGGGGGGGGWGWTTSLSYSVKVCIVSSVTWKWFTRKEKHINPLTLLGWGPPAEQWSASNSQHATDGYQLATDKYQLTTRNWQISTDNLQLTTRSWQISTDNSQLATDNWQISTRNWQISTRNWQISTDSSQLATDNSQLATRNWQVSISPLPQS